MIIERRREKKLPPVMMEETTFPVRRSSDLHNFKTLPTSKLTWGTQKLMRSAKLAAVDPHHHHHRGSNSTEFNFKRTRPSILKFTIKNNARSIGAGGVKDDDYEGIGFGIDAVRQKLTADLKTAADTMKLEILNHHSLNNERGREELEVGDLSPAAVTAAAVEEEAVDRPWNLRKRRAACNAPPNPIAYEKTTARQSPNATRTSRLRGIGGKKTAAEAKVRFSVNLSKREIEEDYLMMIGEKPPRRPEKRSKTLQKQLDKVFPGLWLSEVIPDMYKVQEFPTPKRSRCRS